MISDNYTDIRDVRSFQIAARKRERSIMDETVEIVDDSTICVLPSEILCEIFAFLSLADRKSVRLVCRSWCDCCSCSYITRRERFVFRADSGVEVAAGVMLRSKYSKRANLEFQGLPVSDIPASSWEECGKEIRELKFYCCQWDDTTIRNIILHCESLTSFLVSFELDSQRYTPYSPSLLNYLIKKGIRRPNLHTLSIRLGSDEDESVLRKIFLIHPCIKHLCVRTTPNVSLRLDQCFNSDTQLETLTLVNTQPDGGWMETLSEKAKLGSRLKRLDARINCRSTTKDTIFDFFESQRRLEAIRLALVSANNTEAKDLFFHILKSCPNLQEFRLETYAHVHLEHSELPRFLTSISKLNFLGLNFSARRSNRLPWFSNLPASPVQAKLISLKWEYSSYGDQDFCDALLSRCPSLRHLYLAEAYDTALQIIFQYLPKLQTLILACMAGCINKFRFSGRDADGNESDYSIKRLRQLTYLKLPSTSFNVRENCMLEMQLPRLKFLSLSVDSLEQLSAEALSEFASNLPQLTTLSVQCCAYRMYTERTIQFCKRLDNLNHLNFSWPLGSFPGVDTTPREKDPEEEERAKSIFSACHRLRYSFWTGGFGFNEGRMYIRDPSTGEVLRKDEYNYKFPWENIFWAEEFV